MRNHREGAPPKLAEEIKGFTTQEVIHSREHDAFNKAAIDAGYDLKPLEERLQNTARLYPFQAADRVARLDHGARTFHGDFRP